MLRPAPAVSLESIVSRVDDLTSDVRAITLHLQNPARLEFLPGQFVSFSIARSGQRFGATRAYSIASSPDRDDEVVLLLNLVPGGPGSEYLFGLNVGDPVQCRGPFGTFVLASGTRPLLFVATGTGIAPLWSMLWWLSAHDPERHVTFVWGLRHERDLYYQAEFAQLGERMPHLNHVTTLSQPEATWTGATGRVQAALQSRITTVNDLDAYLCGNGAMIRDVAEWLRAQGDCQIHREPYYVDRAPSNNATSRLG